MKEFKSCFAKDIEKFLRFRTELGYSNCSFAFYLEKFDCYCCDENHTTRELPQSLIMGWLNKAIDNGERGLKCRGRAMRAFAKYLQSEGVSVFIAPIKYFETKSPFVPYILSTAELASFFAATDNIARWLNGDAFSPSVAPVIFRMMYACGLRPTEARLLKRDDVEISSGEVLITKNKTHKERIIVMSDDMTDLCKRYENRRNDFFVRSSYYFPRIDGSAYSNQSLNNLCHRCWQYANSDIPSERLPRLRPYDFRHCFATSVLQKWLDEGQDLLVMLPYLRAYMGHTHIEDTAYYIHILPERLIKSPGVAWDNMDDRIPEVSVWED